jgi:hypothetical protein
MTEAEAQSAVVRWFRAKCYRVTEKVRADVGNTMDVLAQSDEEEWRSEIKGDYDKSTAQYTVNFDTGMGQLLKSIIRLNSRTKYGLAFPISRTEEGARLSYRSILAKYSRSVAFEALNIHLLLVRDDESVEVVAPHEVCEFLNRWA